MPDYTRRGIRYPIPNDYIKDGSSRSKLARDIRDQAQSTDAAIGAEGSRAQQAATHTATNAAISDANRKYGDLPGRIAETESLVDQQNDAINGHSTRISAVETLGGLDPGDVSDATIAGVVSNPESQSSESLRETYELRSVNNTKNYTGTSQQRLEKALADAGIVQLDEPVTHTGNIAGLWSTNIYGTGVIALPDGSTFTPDPKPASRQLITNTIYLDASNGNDNNDGLTPGTAMRTRRAVYENVLRRLTAQQAAGARWIIQLKGTFTDPGFIMNQLPDFPRTLIWRGEPPVNGLPVTEIVYPGTGSNMGIYIEPGVDEVIVEHIHFRGWTVGFNGYGAIMKYGGKFVVRECEFTENDIGLAAIQNTSFTFSRNHFNPGNNTAISTQYNATGSANYNTLNGGGFFLSYLSAEYRLSDSEDFHIVHFYLDRSRI